MYARHGIIRGAPSWMASMSWTGLINGVYLVSIFWRHVVQQSIITYTVRFCAACLAANPTLVITLKPPARKSDRKHHHLNYASLDAGLPSADAGRWSRMLEGKVIPVAKFVHMEGKDVGIEWLEDDEANDEDDEGVAGHKRTMESKAMTEPIIIDSPDGLGMKMPEEEDFGVEEVAELVGEDFPVEVIGAQFSCCVQSRNPKSTFFFRRRNTIYLSGLDAWQMGRLFRALALRP